MNLFFLNAGRRCELIDAFRAALGRRGGGLLLGSDISPLAPARETLDAFFRLPRTDHPSFLNALAEINRDHPIDLLIPTIDPDLERLDHLRDAIADACPGLHLLLPPSRTIRDSADKRLSRRRFTELGVSVPEALTPEEAPARLPVFGKPARGSAGQGAGVIPSAALLQQRLADDPELLIESLIDGPEYTVDVLCSLTGEALIAVPRRRLRVRGGEVVQGVVERNPELETLALRIAEGFGATGPVTVQMRKPANGPWTAIEMNARMGGGLPLSIAAGADWPGWILDMAQGREPLIGAIADGTIMTRCDRSIFLPADSPETPDPLPHTTCGALIFDLDDTLYPEAEYVLSGYQRVADKVWSDAHVDIEPLLRARFLSGRLGDPFTPALHQAGVPADEAYLRELVELYRAPREQLRPYRDTSILGKLRQAGLRLGLVSDGALAVQQGKWAALGLADCFDAVVFTDALGGRAAWKPSPVGFERCLRELALRPDEAWYIGDNPAKDFLAPRALGMGAVRIARPGTLHERAIYPCREARPHVTIASLAELPGLVWPPSRYTKPEESRI